jgi:hypothetical protein
VIIGVYAGAKTTGFAQAEVVAQVQATMLPLWNPGNIAASINNIVLVVGVVCTLVFFFFSTEHKGPVGGALMQQGSLLVGPGHERLADYLPGGDPAGTLARGAVTLTELLGRRPDPAPFRAALVRAWEVRARPS